MSEGPAADIFRLSLPADPKQVGAARLFVATTFRMLDADEDLVADLKLAVSEAASAIVRAQGLAGRILIEISSVASGETVTIGPLTSDDMAADDGIAPGDVVVAVFRDARIDEHKHALVIPVKRPRDP